MSTKFLSTPRLISAFIAIAVTMVVVALSLYGGWVYFWLGFLP